MPRHTSILTELLHDATNCVFLAKKFVKMCEKYQPPFKTSSIPFELSPS